MAKRFALIIGLSILSGLTNETLAQKNINGSVNTITTAVPFLRISPDARSGAMGDIGIAISPDANAQYWNLAKLPFSQKKFGVSLTYTPWLKEAANQESILSTWAMQGSFQTIFLLV